MGRLTLVTGGGRCGKSSWALSRGEKSNEPNKVFIASAVVFDDEMRERVENHKKERGEQWVTVEAPYDLPDAVSNLKDQTVAIVDCCTVWLGNIWYKFGTDEKTLSTHIDKLCNALEEFRSQKNGEIILVSNEVGWGIIPADPGVRRYADWIGKMNQRIASTAQNVYVCVAGISMQIKRT